MLARITLKRQTRFCVFVMLVFRNHYDSNPILNTIYFIFMIQSSYSAQAILSVLKSKNIRSFEQLLNTGLQPQSVLDLNLFRKPKAIPLIFMTEFLDFEDATLLLLQRQSFVGFGFQGQSLLEKMVEARHLKAFKALLEQGLQLEHHLESSFWQVIRLHFNEPRFAKLFFIALLKAGFSLESVQETIQERNLNSIFPLLYSYQDEAILQKLPAGKEEIQNKRL